MLSSLLLIQAVLQCLIWVVHADQVQVTIENGPIVGENIIADNRPLSRFLGIPYAQPPIGKLRFRIPLPIEKWREPLQATNWPNGCVQFMGHPFVTLTSHLLKNQNTSEDCLYLNVWSPNVNEEEDQLRPVIVWIHGGGFIVGTSAFDIFDGETLASRADAVVVSMNYRLE